LARNFLDVGAAQYLQSLGNILQMQNKYTEAVDMCAMPIWSETTKINTTKTKISKRCEGPGQPVL